MKMFNTYKLAIVALVVVVAAITAAEARPPPDGNSSSSSSSSGDFCGMNLKDVMSCKPALISAETQPLDSCCNALEDAKIPCLCLYKGYLPAYGMDPDLAMQLPVKCKLPNAKSFRC